MINVTPWWLAALCVIILVFLILECRSFIQLNRVIKLNREMLAKQEETRRHHGGSLSLRYPDGLYGFVERRNDGVCIMRFCSTDPTKTELPGRLALQCLPQLCLVNVNRNPRNQRLVSCQIVAIGDQPGEDCIDVSAATPETLERLLGLTASVNDVVEQAAKIAGWHFAKLHN